MMSKPRPAELEFLREWVRAFFGGRCVRCQESTRIVHEIQSRAERPADYWAVENMVCLCETCHDWAHSTPSSIVEPILHRCQQVAMAGRSLDGPLAE